MYICTVPIYTYVYRYRRTYIHMYVCTCTYVHSTYVHILCTCTYVHVLCTCMYVPPTTVWSRRVYFTTKKSFMKPCQYIIRLL